MLLWSSPSIGQSEGTTIDQSKHEGLIELDFEGAFKVLHSNGHEVEAEKQASLISDAYQFLSEIMGPKSEFCILVVAIEDWAKNAYMPVPGLPEYYKGNIIVGAGQNAMADDYAQMLGSFPPEMTSTLYEIYKDEKGNLDMKLFFDKLAIHELTHNFQDPNNQAGYSISRWLEEIHANMGLYAYYKSNRPNELKYITTLVDFSVENPPPSAQFTSLQDFDTNYYSMSPGDYGMYQMKFTKAAEKIIDSLGNDMLKPLNDFIVKYDESYKDKMSFSELSKKLGEEVHPLFVEIITNWQ
ncbi:MAG: hypothetical protein ED555_01905 [Allomuricauda sp.]|nr:MAG: hypothetical protein ED555_01905 [Allomuricauda sp.]